MEQNAALCKDQKVWHKIFGKGRVVEITEPYILICFGDRVRKFRYPDCIVSGFIAIDDGTLGVIPPKMKVGDRVKPTTMIPVSNKKMMFEDEWGSIIEIETRQCDSWIGDYPPEYFYIVKRERDGAVFKAHERLWEKQ